MRRGLADVVLAVGLSGAMIVEAEETLSFYISNHDQSPLLRVMHPIVGKTNFVYDAKGELEKIPCGAIAFLIRDSENVVLRNLRLDWERPSMTEAGIVGFGAGETMVEIDRRRFPVEIRDGRLRMLGPGWSCETDHSRLFDAESHEMLSGVGDICFDGAARELADGRLALKRDFSKDGARVGDVIALRPKGRPAPMVVVYNSRNTVLEDVIIHDAHGMALLAQRSENVVWRGTRSAAEKTSGVFPRPGCFASTHADASHFSNVKGQVTIENCWFEGMMDDAINVHSTCLAITNVVAANRIRCRYMHPQAVGFEVFKPGEMLRLVNGRTLENGPEIGVVAVETHDVREVTLTLAERLPEGWGVGDTVENADYQCAAAFRSNVVCCNRARGALFTTPKSVLVESNVFDRVTGAAILFSGDNYYWYESGACRDVTIRKNVFSNCFTAAGGYSLGVLSFYPVVRDVDAQKTYYHGNVLVEDNAFIGFDAPLLFALSVENLIWRNNRLSYHNRYAGLEQPPYILRHTRHVQIDGHRFPEDTRMDVAARSECDFNEGWVSEPTAVPGMREFRKSFALPPESEGQCLFFDWRTPLAGSEVWLNGLKVGEVADKDVPVRMNLTVALRRVGEINDLRIRSAAESIRNVRMVRTPPLHIGIDGALKGPLPFVPNSWHKPSVWGGVVAVSNCLGTSSQEIKRRVFYEGCVIDEVAASAESVPIEGLIHPDEERWDLSLDPEWQSRYRVFQSSKDGSIQPFYWYDPGKTENVPLVVALHSWGASCHWNSPATSVLRYCRRNGWAMAYPNFRGPNVRPEACGSELAMQDILDVIDWAKSERKVDGDRIYIIGGSGGGYMSLLMAGCHPEVFAGAVAFCPISDLARWHADSTVRKNHYADDIMSVCGGLPAERPAEYRRRSVITHLSRAIGLPVYIATGIHDGHRGSVPVGHAIRAFNVLADEVDRISEEDIAFIEENEKIPETRQFKWSDPFYGPKIRVHLRATSSNVRLTIFEGGHDGNYPAGLDFLSRQCRGRTVDMSLPHVVADGSAERVAR